MSWLPIKYRDFHDMPRAIVVEHKGDVYLIDSPFNNTAGEYPDYFDVYRLHPDVASRLDASSWEALASEGDLVGRVPANAVELDPSRRTAMNEAVFRLLRNDWTNA